MSEEKQKGGGRRVSRRNVLETASALGIAGLGVASLTEMAAADDDTDGNGRDPEVPGFERTDDPDELADAVFERSLDYGSAETSGRPEQFGIFTDPLQGFPVDDGDRYSKFGAYGAMSTGRAADVPGIPALQADTAYDEVTEENLGVGPFDTARFQVELEIPPDTAALSFDYRFMTDEDVQDGFTTSDDVFLVRLELPESGFEEQIAAENASSDALDAPTPEDVRFDFVTGIQTAGVVIGPQDRARTGRLTLTLSDEARPDGDSAVFFDDVTLTAGTP